MRYKEFQVENYKAIESLRLPISQNVIPLIGVNESGKTTVLQAILAFDKQKDALLNGSHIDSKNRYRVAQEVCTITAYIEFSSRDELEDVGREAKLKLDDGFYLWVSEQYKGGRLLAICRSTKDEHNPKNTILLKKYTLPDCPHEYEQTSQYDSFVKALTKRLPTILYFDDFSDRVPTRVEFPADYSDDARLTSRGARREWQELVEEIFKRAHLDDDISLKDFLGLGEDDRENILSDVAKMLNKEIIEEWDKLKKANSALAAGEPDALELRIKYSRENNQHVFTFKVQDSSSNDERTFSVSDRSKGFQWFFNFITKLKFNPEYVVRSEDAIYLLDEPGSYLHSSAQSELLNKLCEIAENNTIIYCTHSEHLLDPQVISVGNIGIIDKTDGIIRFIPYGESDGVRDRGAFSALYDALHLKFGALMPGILDKCLVTEGIIDYYLFDMLLRLPKNVVIIPGAGCDQLKDLISIVIASSSQFLVVFDRDNSDVAVERYTKYFGRSFADNCYQYEFLPEKKNFRLENLLSVLDQEKLQKVAGANTVKKALIKVYFDNELKKEFIKGVDKETQARLSELRGVICKHLNIA